MSIKIIKAASIPESVMYCLVCISEQRELRFANNTVDGLFAQPGEIHRGGGPWGKAQGSRGQPLLQEKLGTLQMLPSSPLLSLSTLLWDFSKGSLRCVIFWQGNSLTANHTGKCSCCVKWKLEYFLGLPNILKFSEYKKWITFPINSLRLH